ncbi:hypothetical protein JNUCC64_07820 [Streptomyces sp. JNUCC 64]
MPFPLPSRDRSGPSRRSLFTGLAGAALVTGCTTDRDDGASKAAERAESAAGPARRTSARESRELAGRYDAVIAAHPSLAGRLAPLRAEVVRHERAFTGAGSGATASAAPPSDGSAAGKPVPDQPRAALAALAGRERELATARTERALEVPGELARLLASVAAAGAAHAYLLTEDDK